MFHSHMYVGTRTISQMTTVHTISGFMLTISDQCMVVHVGINGWFASFCEYLLKINAAQNV